jgi:hypothetical protein
MRRNRIPQGARSAGPMGAGPGSQHAQTRPGPPRHPRNVAAGGRLTVRLPQTGPDTGFVPGGQGVRRFIRPSRPEGPGQKGYRVPARAPFRSSGANREQPQSHVFVAACWLGAPPGPWLGRCCPPGGRLCRRGLSGGQPGCCWLPVGSRAGDRFWVRISSMAAVPVASAGLISCRYPRPPWNASTLVPLTATPSPGARTALPSSGAHLAALRLGCDGWPPSWE